MAELIYSLIITTILLVVMIGNNQIKKPAVENQLLTYFYGDGGI